MEDIEIEEVIKTLRKKVEVIFYKDAPNKLQELLDDRDKRVYIYEGTIKEFDNSHSAFHRSEILPLRYHYEYCTPEVIEIEDTSRIPPISYDDIYVRLKDYKEGTVLEYTYTLTLKRRFIVTKLRGKI